MKIHQYQPGEALHSLKSQLKNLVEQKSSSQKVKDAYNEKRRSFNYEVLVRGKKQTIKIF